MKIAIIGAGAAGCFAAANIPYREGTEVVVFEKTGKAMQKVKVSGGGRCNVTHSCFDLQELAEKYPRGKQLLRKTFHRFSPADTISWFGQRGVALKTEADGRMFPVTDDSQTIIDCIWKTMMKEKVQVRFHKSLVRIERQEQGFMLHFADKTTYSADKVLISTGGYPKQEQYAWIEELPQAVETPVPSLFTFNVTQHPVTELMGLSAEVTVKIMGTKFKEQGPLLITHWGFSGPVVLRCSAWAARALHEKNYQFSISINWLLETTEADLKEQIAYLRREEGRQLLQHKNPFGLPRRLWEYLLVRSGISDSTRWGELPAAQQNKLFENLLRDTYEVKGKTTFKEEFVTCGGVELKDLDPQTMESRRHKGLYFAGEVTDVDGITGGFNFQNAWTGAWVAAQSISAVAQ
ncbi:MAG TPA: NAD(P)/FAD-dependent oxidoreductase [Chitinophagaceae bacterium]|nr:NAD(P)/FAD-dependent oxidoreductase [Chitinophagaceae bacterium]